MVAMRQVLVSFKLCAIVVGTVPNTYNVTVGSFSFDKAGGAISAVLGIMILCLT